jgi:hypothetical protein
MCVCTDERAVTFSQHQQRETGAEKNSPREQKEQRAESREQRAESREQRAESREQRAESRETREQRRADSSHTTTRHSLLSE